MADLFSISDHVIVCGFGTSGRAVAHDLRDESVPIVVVDQAPEIASQVTSDGHLVLLGDAMDPDVLKEAGIERARGIIVLLHSESDNLFVVMTARELNPDVFIIARHDSAHARSKFIRGGADRVVNPFEGTGRPIGAEFVRPAVMDLLRIFARETDADSEVRVREITIEKGSELEGKSLRDAAIRSEYDVIVIAMRREGSTTRFNPDPGHCFEAGDVLVCMGKLARLKELYELGRGAIA